MGDAGGSCRLSGAAVRAQPHVQPVKYAARRSQQSWVAAAFQLQRLYLCLYKTLTVCTICVWHLGVWCCLQAWRSPQAAALARRLSTGSRPARSSPHARPTCSDAQAAGPCSTAAASLRSRHKQSHGISSSTCLAAGPSSSGTAEHPGCCEWVTALTEGLCRAPQCWPSQLPRQPGRGVQRRAQPAKQAGSLAPLQRVCRMAGALLVKPAFTRRRSLSTLLGRLWLVHAYLVTGLAPRIGAVAREDLWTG